MRKLALILLLALGTASAQTTVTIPATPEQTFTFDTCTYVPATGILTINGVQVNSLTLGSLSLNGGPVSPPGTYSVQISLVGGVSTATLVPVGAPAPPAPVTGKTYTVTLANIGGTSWAVVPGLTLAAGQQVTAMAVPTHTGAPAPADWYYYANSQPRIQVDTTNAVYVGVSNSTSTAIAKALVTVVVK